MARNGGTLVPPARQSYKFKVQSSKLRARPRISSYRSRDARAQSPLSNESHKIGSTFARAVSERCCREATGQRGTDCGTRKVEPRIGRARISRRFAPSTGVEGANTQETLPLFLVSKGR